MNETNAIITLPVWMWEDVLKRASSNLESHGTSLDDDPAVHRLAQELCAILGHKQPGPYCSRCMDDLPTR